jgi:hypothetical protein
MWFLPHASRTRERVRNGENAMKTVGRLAASLMLLISISMVLFGTAGTVSAQEAQATPITETTEAAAEPTVTVGPDGEALREPTATEAADIDPNNWPGATRLDCVNATSEHDPSHRFAFVGICESGIRNNMADTACYGEVLSASVQNALLSYFSEATAEAATTADARTEAYDNLEQVSEINWPAFRRVYEDRLHQEWVEGDVPQGVPLKAPDLLSVLTAIHCSLPV